MHVVSVSPVRPICPWDSLYKIREIKRLKALLQMSPSGIFCSNNSQDSGDWQKKESLPASLRRLQIPEYAEESIWARLRGRYWQGSCFRATQEEYSPQQLPAEELSHTLVPCHLAVDVRWRQTYLQMSLIQECHPATCLAHLRTRLNKSGRKLLNRSPSFWNSQIDRRLLLNLVSVRAGARRISCLPSAHKSARGTLLTELWMFAE